MRILCGFGLCRNLFRIITFYFFTMIVCSVTHQLHLPWSYGRDLTM